MKDVNVIPRNGMSLKMFILNTAVTIGLLMCVQLSSASTDILGNNKMIGVAVHDVSSISQVKPFSNSVAITVTSPTQVTSALNLNNNAMRPFLRISDFFMNHERGIYEANGNVWGVATAILNSVHNREIGFFLDEILWRVRMKCQEGKPEACNEVNSGYTNTLVFFDLLVKYFKAVLPHKVYFAHVEAYAEIIVQANQNWDGVPNMLYDADFYGMDCYNSDYYNCGDEPYVNGYGVVAKTQIGILQSYVRRTVDKYNGSYGTRKMITVPAVFAHPFFNLTQDGAVSQLDFYLNSYHNKPIYQGTFGFLYESITIGVGTLQGMRDFAPYWNQEIQNRMVPLK